MIAITDQSPPWDWSGSGKKMRISGVLEHPPLLIRDTRVFRTEKSLLENAGYPHLLSWPAPACRTCRVQEVLNSSGGLLQSRPLCLHAAAGLLTTLINVCTSQGGDWSVMAIIIPDPLQLVELVECKKCWTAQEGCSSNSSCYDSHHLHAAAGLLTTLINVCTSQGGDWSVMAIITTAVTTNIDESGQQPGSSMQA
jgi:hypothetical protein